MKGHILSEYDTVVTEQVISFRFLSSIIISLDMNSSITTGTSPYLLPYYPQLISSGSQIKLEEVMGCKNYTMLQIGSIAALHESKVRALNEGNFDSVEFQRATNEIGNVLENALTRGFLKSLKISADISGPTFEVMADTHTRVTRIFALMALIYLHLVSHGFQQLELLTRISETMGILQLNTSKQLFSAIVTPLFIIASVARQGDEQGFFREVFSSAQLLNPLSIQRQRILPILEVIWSSRRTSFNFAWKDCVELTKDIFLM